MNTVVDPQQKMNAAFDNYFALSSMLQKDVSALLDGRNDTTQWKRNFIRASLPLIEGYAHCLREMCAVSFDCIAPPINAKEKDVLLNEKKFGTSERLKLTIKTSYKLFDLSEGVFLVFVFPFVTILSLDFEIHILAGHFLSSKCN